MLNPECAIKSTDLADGSRPLRSVQNTKTDVTDEYFPYSRIYVCARAYALGFTNPVRNVRLGAAIDLAVGQTNRLIREGNAAAQVPWKSDRLALRNGMRAPIGKHLQLSEYFVRAAEQELDKRMFNHIVSVAKSLLGDAFKMGVEEVE